MHLLMLFFIYAFLGWCLEVFYAFTKTKRFVNRGFLNGPFVPIYGVSVMLVHVLITSLLSAYPELSPTDMVAVFVLIISVSTLLELIGGAVLFHLFEARWWDYSHMRFNYKGFISLRFSLIWGFLGSAVFFVFHTRWLYPFIVDMEPRLLNTMVTALSAVFLLDLFFTILALFNFKNLLRELRRRSMNLRNATEKMENHLGDETFQSFRQNLNGFIDRIKNHERLSSLKVRFDKLRQSASTIRNKAANLEFETFKKLVRKITGNRLYKAFPEVKIALKDEEGEDGDYES